MCVCYVCGYKCGYMRATEWLHVDYELLSKCMHGYVCGCVMVTCWGDVGDMLFV